MMLRVIVFILGMLIIPTIGISQPKSLHLSATAGVNRYFGLEGDFNHPITEYEFGKAGSLELGYISGTKYLPGQYAIGLVCDYYSGTFREYGDRMNEVEYLNGEVSKIMLGGYVIPMIFDVDESFIIKPGIEWTARIKSKIEGEKMSDEGQTFGMMLPLDDEFARKSDFGVVLNLEYLFEFKRSNWYLCPRFKAYYSLFDVLPEMQSFRAMIGFSIGYKLKEQWYPHGPTFFNER
jgi:hypothetical protein